MSQPFDPQDVARKWLETESGMTGWTKAEASLAALLTEARAPLLALLREAHDIIRGQLPYDPHYDGPSDLVGRDFLASIAATLGPEAGEPRT